MDQEHLIEADFIGHCEDERCDLGRLEYTCPSCNKAVTDYGQAALEAASFTVFPPYTTNCPECGTQLKVIT